MGNFFSDLGDFLDGFGTFLLKLAEGFVQALNECRNTSYPDAVGFAFKGISETTADPLFERYLSVNSSQHLDYHYASVRDSLTPVQLTGFDQSLQTTLGGEGTVVFGSVGVVALALAMLFDLLAAQVKGQAVPPDPIKQIFRGEGEALSSMRNSISDCLFRLPRCGNDPKKMLEETNHCSLQVGGAIQNYTLEILERAQATGHSVNITARNHVFNAHLFYFHLGVHKLRLDQNPPSNMVPILVPTDELTDHFPLIYVFAPNVTYAKENWKNSDTTQFCLKSWVTLLILFMDESQNAYSTSFKDIDELKKQDTKFVVSK